MLQISETELKGWKHKITKELIRELKYKEEIRQNTTHKFKCKIKMKCQSRTARKPKRNSFPNSTKLWDLEISNKNDVRE